MQIDNSDGNCIVRKHVLVLALLLCGDIEANPGPKSGSTYPPNVPISDKNSNFRTLVINANSIMGKRSSLEHLISHADPDLILMTETKLGPNIITAEFMPENHNYTVYRRDRKRGVGAFLLQLGITTIVHPN